MKNNSEFLHFPDTHSYLSLLCYPWAAHSISLYLLERDGGGGVRGETSFYAKASPTYLQVWDTKLNKLISLSLFQMQIIFTHELHRKDCLSALFSPTIYPLLVILD